MAPSTSPNLNAIQILGNASAINGLLPASAGGTLFPDQSTRPSSQIALVTGLNNTSITDNDFIGSSLSPSLGDPGVFVADVTLVTEAATLKGTGTTGFSGSSAISAATAVGINNSPFDIGGLGVVSAATPTVPLSGSIFSEAKADAASTAFTGTGETPANTSAAAVVDLAGAGITNSNFKVEGAKVVSFVSDLNGDASAQGGTEVGMPTAAGTARALNDATPSTGVTSILNLNSRGINNQTAYFQTPISPFFAQFGGLPLPQTPITSFVTGRGLINTYGAINAGSEATGTSSAQNGKGDANAFAGVFSAGALLNQANIQASGSGSTNSFTTVSLVGQDNTGAKPIETYSSTGEGAASSVSNLLSVGAGTAAVEFPPGPAPIPAQFLYINGNGNPTTGSVLSNAVNRAQTTAKTDNGDAVSYTGGLNGTGGNTFAPNFSAGNTLTIGLFNVNVIAGTTTANTNNNVNATATSEISNLATTKMGSAIASNTGFSATPGPKGGITSGIFGFDLASGNNNTIDIKGDGNVIGEAAATTTVQASSLMGTSSANAFDTVSGISNIDFTISGVGGVGGTGKLVSTVTAGVVAP